MLLWECTYTLTDKYGSETWVEYYWSVHEPTATTPQHRWDVVFPGNYTVSNFSAKVYAGKDMPQSGIVRTININKPA